MAKANNQILLNSFVKSHLCSVLECRNLVCHVAQQEPLGCDSQKKKKNLQKKKIIFSYWNDICNCCFKGVFGDESLCSHTLALHHVQGAGAQSCHPKCPLLSLNLIVSN